MLKYSVTENHMPVLCLPTESHTWSPAWSEPCGHPTITESVTISVTAIFGHCIVFLKIKGLLLSGHVPSCSVLPYVHPLLRLPSAVVKGVECVGVGRGPICRQAPRTLRRWAEKMRTPNTALNPRAPVRPAAPCRPCKISEKASGKSEK